MMLKQMKENIDIFLCPACRGDLTLSGEDIKCLKCRNKYTVEDGIPLFFLPSDTDGRKREILRKVKSFYEETPFPNYEKYENIDALFRKAKLGVFARLMDAQIPYNDRVLDVGCGTGQLSNFLGLSNRPVFGTDMCLNPLKLGQKFKINNNIRGTGFYQMNLFRPIFKEESFPLVICNGVLHHTADPFRGFEIISGLVKKGGYILVGLYNAYGRINADIRRGIFNISGGRFLLPDNWHNAAGVSDVRKLAWLRDQYMNPHESKHTIGEVLRWFDNTGFDFINSIPKPKAFDIFSQTEKLFEPNAPGDLLDRFLIQARMSFTGNRDGGLFIMIGKKRAL
ncbi:MAG: methyltransferase domain-containing protein [Candidatus Omnitrophica bacterium]|nr:methyltransferase domain-containing protein [Candidatus Omnitrophota bacterium]